MNIKHKCSHYCEFDSQCQYTHQTSWTIVSLAHFIIFKLLRIIIYFTSFRCIHALFLTSEEMQNDLKYSSAICWQFNWMFWSTIQWNGTDKNIRWFFAFGLNRIPTNSDFSSTFHTIVFGFVCWSHLANSSQSQHSSHVQRHVYWQSLIFHREQTATTEIIFYFWMNFHSSHDATETSSIKERVCDGIVKLEKWKCTWKAHVANGKPEADALRGGNVNARQQQK